MEPVKTVNRLRHPLQQYPKFTGHLKILLPRICRVVGFSGCRQIEKINIVRDILHITCYANLNFVTCFVYFFDLLATRQPDRFSVAKLSVIFRYIWFRGSFGRDSGFGIREIDAHPETKFRYIPKPKGFQEVSVSDPMFSYNVS